MRHAVYYAPDLDHPLAELAEAWLGRDAAGAPVATPDLLPPDLHAEIVAAPARYGFHATLKAPFRLAEGASEEALAAAVEQLAGQVGVARLPVMTLARIDRFFALVPAIGSEPLDYLAARVVEELDAFRAPTTEEELRRRRAAGLSGPEEANLRRWGYPYVFDTFRFHMTLTGPVAAERAPAVEAALTGHFGPVIGRSLNVDRLCLYRQAEPEARFVEVASHRIRRLHNAGIVRVEAI